MSSTSTNNNSTTLLSLPTELLCEIASTIDSPETLLDLSLVNHRLHSIACLKSTQFGVAQRWFCSPTSESWPAPAIGERAQQAVAFILPFIQFIRLEHNQGSLDTELPFNSSAEPKICPSCSLTKLGYGLFAHCVDCWFTAAYTLRDKFYAASLGGKLESLGLETVNLELEDILVAREWAKVRLQYGPLLPPSWVKVESNSNQKLQSRYMPKAVTGPKSRVEKNWISAGIQGSKRHRDRRGFVLFLRFREVHYSGEEGMVYIVRPRYSHSAYFKGPRHLVAKMTC
ncbi:hypothetical protein BJ508DRAFT_325316 [Ascobolus immersus RN42]|uniref:F-box domain-containing protein n=1 Tax=Ascobolus immersus RN42 TaxID=1160509 RepID=A0A3N4ILT7_ASCIM|nr:hypothetical protein BJ508DRAFT_325316 [Ascobolus immersus RN42]